MISKRLFFILTLFSFLFIHSQNRTFSNEFGIHAGISSIASDYQDFFSFSETNYGYSVGILHYMNFLCAGNCSAFGRGAYFKDHFKVRNEFLYSRFNLKHHGGVVDNNPDPIEGQRFKNMKGQTSIYQLGSFLEYYPWSIRVYESGGARLLPSIGIGAYLSYYTPDNYSTAGFLGDPAVTPSPYINTIKNENGFTASLAGSGSLRIKLSAVEDILLKGQAQYFLSDYIEGVSFPNSTTDIVFNISVGYIYYLD